MSNFECQRIITHKSSIKKMFHIGSRIKEVFESLPKPHNIEWFADSLNCRRANIYNIFNRRTIDTDLLKKISSVLDHDFFHDISEDMMLCRGDALSEKQQLYDDIMDRMGRMLGGWLERIEIKNEKA